MDMESTKKTARLAGLLYLLASLPAPFGLVYVPGKILVPGDVTATGDHLRTLGTLLRMGIAAELVGFGMFVFVALVLYRLFKDVSPGPALTMLTLILISIPISFLDVLTEVGAQQLAAGGPFLSGLDQRQRDALASLFLNLHAGGLSVAQIFWGLWLFPFGILVIRSGFIPRVLGYLLFVAGTGNVVSAFADLVVPQYAERVAKVTGIMTFAELPMILWLLIWGARRQRSAARAA